MKVQTSLNSYLIGVSLLLGILLTGCHNDSSTKNYKVIDEEISPSITEGVLVSEIHDDHEEAADVTKINAYTPAKEELNLTVTEANSYVKEGRILLLKNGCYIDLDQDGFCEQFTMDQSNETMDDAFFSITSIDGEHIDLIRPEDNKYTIFRYEDRKLAVFDHLYCDLTEYEVKNHIYIGAKDQCETLIGTIAMPTQNQIKDGKIERLYLPVVSKALIDSNVSYLPVLDSITKHDILDQEFELTKDLDLKKKKTDKFDQLRWKSGSIVKPHALVPYDLNVSDETEFCYWLDLINLDTDESGWILCKDRVVIQQNKSENPSNLLKFYKYHDYGGTTE